MTNHLEATICDGCRLIPLSHLSLDVGEPVVVGWEQLFAERGIEIVLDDIGRPSVERRVLGELIAEYVARQRAAQQAEIAALNKEVPVPVAGVPAEEGLSAVETLMAQPAYEGVQDELGLPKPNFLDEELAESRRLQAASRARQEQEAVETAKKILEGRHK